MGPVRNLLLVMAACSALVAALPGQGFAAELLMLEQKGCAWCVRWHKEIGEIYPKTAEAKIAPLRQVDIHEPWPGDLAAIRREAFTPTFVLVEDGREIARMRGYSGDEFFWFLLDEMLAKLP
ncbi:transcriptional regulator [Salaquimonas pukyongi]|uniref:transcriptional regulator n=1 Tax=Salaquimonas pukyongi TaxID=2712698 RepID=UPI00096B879C|nr:transcriptional regulator [Salaquimonas pukyongi]